MEEKSVLDFTMKDITGAEVPLRRYAGKALLVVNVASRCGLTPQYKGLETLYERFKDTGLVILGFPANNFLWQEPGTNEDIQSFCSLKYGVSFPLFSKISVKGRTMHPLYRFLTDPATNPATPGGIRWNFAKFLVDRKGSLVARFDPQVEPLAPEVTAAIEKVLAG